ncbi:hypothetical protein HZC33_00235 [Candidatus Wolfebacteria bacterium]|nr:hypothetical protein [Candidatus Wolfebacteria bacterium]
MRKLRAIILGVKLLASLFLFKLRKETFKVSLASSILLHFAKAIKSDVSFSTTPEQQKRIISKFAKMSRLINDALESENISQEKLFKIVQNNSQEMHGGVGEITRSFSDIKSIVAKSPHLNEFLENVEKSWKANDLRNIKSNRSSEISHDNILKATKESGGYFFLALTYLLNPKGLDEGMKEAIYNSGVWFQFLDDYRDRKEDISKKNTLFTETSDPHEELLKKYVAESITEIKKAIGEQHALIRFMENLTMLVLLLDFAKLDWK